MATRAERWAFLRAVRAGDVERVCRLLASAHDPAGRAGRSIRCRDGGRRSMLAVAVEHGHADLVPVLLAAGASPHRRRWARDALLPVVFATGDRHLVRAVLAATASVEWDVEEREAALFEAVRLDRPDLLDLLDLTGVAAKALGTEAAWAAAVGAAAAVRWLLGRGVSPDHVACPDDGETLLHRAASGSAATSVAVLLGAGADPEARDRLGRTALMRAAYSAGPVDPSLSVLLDAGADATVTDDAGLDALDHLRASAGDGPVDEMSAARRLRAAGASGQPAADRAVVRAARNGDAAALRRALADGGSPSAATVTKRGGTERPLTLAGRHVDLTCLRLLLDAGADPDKGGSDGPPVVILSAAGKQRALGVLLDAGADVHAIGPGGTTALAAAEAAARPDVAALLRDRGATSGGT